ncbi:kynureninase [Casimicrobium huifangae]|uniref:kynureninase n=1 Tax=Casimicrobium huifangae TaxID=2591109 RepID=UPI0012EBD215|nr:kynureninase [Casimicrobium huifangae]
MTAGNNALASLAGFRDQFVIPDGVIYLDGNSLGVLPKAAITAVRRTVEEEWGQGLIRSWNTADWVNAPRRCGDKIARLIGADAGEVIACDSTSLNLFKALVTALQLQSLRPDAAGRNVIVSDIDNFPTDLYIAQGLQALLAERKLELRFVKRHELEATLREVGSRTAVVMLTQVDYRSGGRYVMQGVTEVVQSHGALMLWDLAHSTCAFPVSLNACKADLAVGCTYKYVNAGPGAPAFVFAAKRHLDALDAAAVPAPISGWFAHEAPFAFDPKFRVARGVERFTVGTPPILQFAALEAALDVWLSADMNLVREASVALTTRFIAEVEQHCGGMGLTLATPRDSSIRGSQVSFRHAEGYAIMQALIARGVIGDFRAPDILRFGFTPLYVTEADVVAAASHLRDVMKLREYERAEFRARSKVT